MLMLVRYGVQTDYTDINSSISLCTQQTDDEDDD